MSEESFPARYGVLDGLPPALFRPVVTHLHGELLPRARGVLELRRSLIAGRLPLRLSWPAGSIGAVLLESLRDAHVADVCRGDPEHTDEIILYILGEMEEAHRLYERALLAFIELGRRESFGADGDGMEAVAGGRVLDEATLKELRAKAEKLAVQAATEQVRHRLGARFGARMEVLGELRSLLEAIAASVGAPPGAMNGALRSFALDDVVELRDALARLAGCEELLRRLGRETESDDPSAGTTLLSIVRKVTRTVERPGEVGGAHTVRGVERTGEVERMLASEAALLTSPRLRGLWHARRAERALLGYHAVGVLTSRIQTLVHDEVERDDERPAERGPIIVVLDTSGSMMGGPERLAKALVLQLMTVAFMTERGCYGFNFSGPGDLDRHELTFDADGLAHAMHFTMHSFHGGTVPDTALRAAFELAESEEWQEADVVLVSDGYFEVARHTLGALARVRRGSRARLHGVRLGFRWDDLHPDVQAAMVASEVPDGFGPLECDEMHDLDHWVRAVAE